MAVNIYAAQEAIMLSPESAEALFFIFKISFLFCMCDIKPLKARQHGQIGAMLSMRGISKATTLTEFQVKSDFKQTISHVLVFARTN